MANLEYRCLPMPGSTRRHYPWWEFLVPGVCFLLGSIYVWWFLSDMERTPGVHQLPTPSALLYEWGGKWPVVAFVASVGVLLSGIGIGKLIKKFQQDRR